MDLENEYRETKIMKTATNSAPTTPLKRLTKPKRFFFNTHIVTTRWLQKNFMVGIIFFEKV